ncbi:MAG: hypothetical protein DRP42_04275 [Tenericutes bacterium]|nr:MAG: hypothetical protein DRP42_04275 [Mycoplasmatota bacterium]
MVDNGFENDRGFDPYFTFNTLESVRFYSIFSQVHYANRTNLVMSMIFLGIVTFVLILLISKRIKDSSKQIGTLKALGMKNSSIASSYILSPLLIILFGTFIAIAISIPVQMI